MAIQFDNLWVKVNGNYYFENREEAYAVLGYLSWQCEELKARVVEFSLGYAVQRYKSGPYWNPEACIWDNGCKVGEYSEYEQRHNLDA